MKSLNPRIGLEELNIERDDVRLLEAVGWEPQIYLCARKRPVGRIKRNLCRRPRNWLTKASARMADAVRAEKKQWARAWKNTTRSGENGY